MDRWLVYNQLDLALRQLCWVHLKRDFRKWLERGGPPAPGCDCCDFDGDGVDTLEDFATVQAMSNGP